MTKEDLVNKIDRAIEDLRDERLKLSHLQEVADKLDFETESKNILRKRVELMDRIDMLKEISKDLTTI